MISGFRSRGGGMAAVATLVMGIVATGPAAAQETTDTSFNPASRLGTTPVNVTVEVRDDYTHELPSPLYVPLRARLTDPATGEPVPDAYHVKARVEEPGKVSTESYEFAYPFGDTEGALPGVYHGIVIVPAGGTWKVLVNAFNIDDSEDSTLPASLGAAEIEVEVTGPALQSTLGNTDVDLIGDTSPSLEVSELILLYAHSGLGGLWFLLAATVILVAMPARRRLLSASVNHWLDRHTRRLGTTLAWTTGVLWVSGIINLQDLTAYDPPLSGDQWNRLDILPYAKPYIASLYAKIGVYALLSAAVVPLIREAKRRAAEFDSARFHEERVAAATAGAGDGAGEAAGEGAAPASVTRAEAVATATRRPATRAVRTRPPMPAPALASRVGLPARLGVVVVAVGGPVIVLCVTVLKNAHIISEQVRAWQYLQ